jgi:hypothetical protein
MPPFFSPISGEPVQRLSELIRGRLTAAAPINFDEENGLWKVTTPVMEGHTLRVYFDPNTYGAVLGATWANGNPERVWRRVDITMRRLADLWLPSEIVEVGTLEKPPIAYRVAISAIEPNPTCTEELFQFQFPPGTHVEDGIADEFYKVGLDGAKLPWPCGCATTFGADPLE